jgi:hypothetical protein
MDNNKTYKIRFKINTRKNKIKIKDATIAYNNVEDTFSDNSLVIKTINENITGKVMNDILQLGKIAHKDKFFTGNEYVTLEFEVITKDNKVDKITSLKYENAEIDATQASQLLLPYDKTAVIDEGQKLSNVRAKNIKNPNANRDPFNGGVKRY